MKTLTTTELNYFIERLDHCDLEGVKALHRHTKQQARSYQTPPNMRPMWADLRQLLAREIKRY